MIREKEMDDYEFKIAKKLGATVILGSDGGTLMTISRIDGDDIYCKWFDSLHKLHEEKFKEYELSLSELDWKQAVIDRGAESSKKAQEMTEKALRKIKEKG
jgi:uncharacterized protein YodC (DUF2158 family)